MTDLSELKEVLQDISFKIDGIEHKQNEQDEQLGKLEQQLASLPNKQNKQKILCPACQKEYDTEKNLLMHMLHKHPEWIILEKPGTAQPPPEQNKPQPPETKTPGFIEEFYERNKKNIIFVLLALLFLLIAALGVI